MIEPNWLRRAIALAEADTGGIDGGALAALLSEPNEVLPYLFVHANGFAGWPRARAALAQAAANAIGAVRTSSEPGPCPAPASPDRPALYSALRSALVAGEVARARGSEAGDRPIEIAAALHLIGSVRFDENRGADTASMFIRED
jgi:hypothetical protein